jgi:hypothetical protein
MPFVRVNKTFKTKADAEQYVRIYFSNYHPAGYGTELDIKETSDGFVVVGGRWDSCD